MGRKRLHDDGLPERVYAHHGAFWYRPRGGKPFRLCGERREVDGALARLAESGLVSPAAVDPLRGGARPTLGRAVDRYTRDELPKLADETQRVYRKYLGEIRAVFTDAAPEQVTPKMIYAFRDRASRSKGVQVIITAIFRTLYRNMIEWGWADTNPARDVTTAGRKRRNVCPDAAELAAFKAACRDPLIPLYLDFKLAYGFRQKDLLELPPIPLATEVFVVEISKSMRWDDEAGARVGRQVPYEVTDGVREILRAIYALPRPQNSQRLFCTRRGKPLTQVGFRDMWGRAMRRYLAANPGAVRFHEHDIRATVASADREGAQKRLTHMNKSTTDGYLREFGIEPVKPLESSQIPTKSTKVFTIKRS